MRPTLPFFTGDLWWTVDMSARVSPLASPHAFTAPPVSDIPSFTKGPPLVETIYLKYCQWQNDPCSWPLCKWTPIFPGWFVLSSSPMPKRCQCETLPGISCCYPDTYFRVVLLYQAISIAGNWQDCRSVLDMGGWVMSFTSLHFIIPNVLEKH